MLTMKYDDLTRRTTARRRLFGRHGLLDPSAVGPAGSTASSGSRRKTPRDTPGHAEPAPREARIPGGSGRIAPEMPGGAVTLGSLAAGELIDPASARRIACDAGIIPVVLGRDGEILDQGRAVRLFTPGQVRALWRRDQHCTFPGCDVPTAWCDAHHLIHWADGGSTDLSNAALLCARHHTIVHRDQLAGRISAAGPPSTTGGPPGRRSRNRARTPAAVIWDLHPDSYQPPNHGDMEPLSA
jgi:hypothetical protein